MKKRIWVGFAVVAVVILVSQWLVPWLPVGDASKRQLLGKRVKFDSTDEVTLVGSLYKPRIGVGGKAGVVVMLSPYAETRQVYADLAVMLKQAGVGVLTVDVRGSGETGTGASFGPESVRQLPDDAESALRYVRSLRWVDSRRLALLGTGVTANTAVLTAGRDRGLVGLVLISGVFSDEAKELVKQRDFPPLLIFASFQDEAPTYAGKEMRDLSSQPATRLEVYINAGIGSQILFSYDSPEMKKLIVDWLKKRFSEVS